jgi:predicted amidophosphoribosyltransferase
MARANLVSTLGAILDLVAPLRCPVCAGELADGGCAACGLPLPERVVRQIRGDEHGPFLVLAGARFEGPVRRMVHALKYRRDPAALRLLARQTALSLPAELRWDAIVPVPAHAVRARERGWEPVREIARAVARARGLAFTPALRRVRYTEPLAGRNRWERRRVVAGAFRARPVNGDILVLDDVGTTGATFRACRRALLAAGARSVDLLVAALTPAATPLSAGAAGRGATSRAARPRWNIARLKRLC